MIKKDMKVLVVGLKSSGTSAVALLEKLGAEVKIYDDDQRARLNGKTNLIGNSLEYIFEGVSLVVLSPAIPSCHSIVQYALNGKIKIIGEMELGMAYLDCKKIMVTGTNGKTTVVEMITTLLSYAGYNAKSMGNIGYPVSQVVLDSEPLDYAVIEASSFQLDCFTKEKADIAIVTNVSPDHMDRYEVYEDYVKAKSNIFNNQTHKDFALINYDDNTLRTLSKELAAKTIGIKSEGGRSPVHIKNGYYYIKDKALAPIKASKLKGRFNYHNLLMALNVGYILKVSNESMLSLIKNFKISAHRLEYVCTLFNKNYYNDSKGTNIEACKNAIDALNGHTGLIMGGSDKNEDFCAFFDKISDSVSVVCVTGSNADKIYASAQKMGFANIKKFNELRDALFFLSQIDYIDNILFSPACASFDRYSSYMERGNKFKELIYEIEI